MKIDKYEKWDWRNFQRLFAYSPREAFEYRKKMIGDPIPEEYLTEEEKKQEKVETVPTETVVTTEEYTEESLKKLLDENGVAYSHLAKLNGLKKKALENNLI